MADQNDPWHYGPLPPAVPRWRPALCDTTTNHAALPWPPGVYWSLSPRDGGIVILDRYRLRPGQQWQRTPRGTRLSDLLCAISRPPPPTHCVASTGTPCQQKKLIG